MTRAHLIEGVGWKEERGPPELRMVRGVSGGSRTQTPIVVKIIDHVLANCKGLRVRIDNGTNRPVHVFKVLSRTNR